MINTYHSSLPPPIPPRLGSIRPSAGHSKPLLRFLVSMMVLQMVLLLGGFIYLYHREHEYHEEFSHKYLGDMLILRRLEECQGDNQSVLECRTLLETYKNIMAKVSQEEGRAAKFSGNDPNSGAMARMVVKEQVSHSPDKSEFLEWNIEHSVRRNINYYKSSWLKVQLSGDYYIYAQVTFSKWHPKTPLASQVKMRRGEEGKEKTLMTAYCSILQNKTDVCTTYEGGVFSLEPGDQLSVWVSDPTLVSYEVEATTFGLYKL